VDIKQLNVIDCHTHIGRLPGVVGDNFTAEDLMYIVRHEGVETMLASSATATMVSQTLGTTETIDMAMRFSANLKGMLWLNPNDPDWAADVPRAVAQGFVGIKIHPVLDHYNVDQAALDDIFGCAQEHHWPILTHTGNDGSASSALCYEGLVQAYPDVPLIMAHMRLESIPLARRYDNIYLDTTHGSPRIVELAEPIVGPDKILFGTDAPAGFDIGHPMPRKRPRRSYAEIIGDLLARDIPDAAMEKILGANTRVLFGLD